MNESTQDCAVFKAYVSEYFSCEADNYSTCRLTAIDCNKFFCDWTSQIEKMVAKGGILYDLNCTSLQAEDDWSKICRLNQAFYPEDQDSDTYETACLGENDGCEASLKLSSKKILTYDWDITCIPSLELSDGERHLATTTTSSTKSSSKGKKAAGEVGIGLLVTAAWEGVEYLISLVSEDSALAIQSVPIIAAALYSALAF